MRRCSALVAMALACVGGSWPRPALAYDRCDDIQVPFDFYANSPCVGDSIYITFHSCNACVDLWSTWWDQASHTLSLNAIYWPQTCEPNAPCNPESLIAFGGLADSVGNRAVRVRIQTSVVYDSVTCVSERFLDMGYVARDCGHPPPLPPPTPAEDSLQYVDRVQIGASPCLGCPPQACAGQDVPVVLSGIIRHRCYEFRRVELRPSLGGSADPPTVRVVFAERDCFVTPCDPDSVPWERGVLLPALPADNEVLRVESGILVTCGQDSAFTLTGAEYFPFTVSDSCGHAPSDSLYGIDRVAIGIQGCPTCPPVACADQGIPVRIAGALESDCVHFHQLELIPPPPGVIGAPALRVVFSQEARLGIPCQGGPFPWQSATTLDALPPGRYSLPVQSVMRTFNPNGDSTDVLLGSRVFQFPVVDSCPGPPQGPCLWLAWARPGTGEACDARVGPGAPAKLQLQMRASTAVAGFQGKLYLSPFGLHIENIRAVGAAQGMRVLWNPWPGGSSFVLFSESGQLLPPCNPLVDCVDCCEFHPVLEVTVAVDDSTDFAPITQLLVWEVIGADSLGDGIHGCVRDSRDRERMVARICADKPCDANGDGHTDVRDLVKMVNCLHTPGGCAADSAGGSLDCQHDGDFDLDDVLCCAHFLLRGQLPDSAETVPAPQVRLRFGTPVTTATGVDVPARIDGAGRISAARFGLAIPIERFDLVGVSVADQDWLALHEQGNGDYAAGLVRLQSSPRIPEAPDALDFTLHLALRPGQTPGGQLRLVDGDFTGSEGEGLIPGSSDRSVQLGSGNVVNELKLGRPQPNPFSREATLSLSLDHEADVELTVHDLTGRLVTSVHHGRLAAGPHTFTWRGVYGDGTPAANGVYFVRAKIGGRVLSQKVALLRGR